LIPTYTGPIAADTILDPAALSAVVVQVKYKTAGDTKAAETLRPAGVPRDLHQPLPYLALLLELGSESSYQGHSKIKTTASPAGNVDFHTLTKNWLAACGDLANFLRHPENKSKTKQIKKIKEIVAAQRSAMDDYNRYAVFVRGTSSEVYGILKQAQIVAEFGTLLHATLSPPPTQDPRIQQMLPLQRLALTSGHTAWMNNFVAEVGESEEEDQQDAVMTDFSDHLSS
jgi:hypothetical protein